MEQGSSLANENKLTIPSGGSMILYDKNCCLIDHVTWSKKQIDRTEEGVAFMFDAVN